MFAVAQEEREQGRARSAEAHLDALIGQGVPRTLLDRAHFDLPHHPSSPKKTAEDSDAEHSEIRDRGELLLARGAYQEAESDFLAVLDLNPARSGPLVAMAEERIREIRYGYLR